MKSYIECIMEAYPGWPRRIQHGEYIGILSGIQPLLDGNAAPLYRFPGGECMGDPGDAVRTAPVDDCGLLRCGCCGGEILCDKTGDMPALCPTCHEGIDWSLRERSEV